MKREKKKFTLNEKAIGDLFTSEYEYINDLLNLVQIARGLGVQDEEQDKQSKKGISNSQRPRRLFPGLYEKNGRARTVEELQAKLSELRGKHKLPYKEKLIRKGLKNRIKKKEKKERRKMKKNPQVLPKLVETKSQLKTEDVKPIVKSRKPIFNSDGKIVFSKFDFTGLGDKKESNKSEKDPLNALKKLKKQQEKILELNDAGEKEKVVQIKSRIAWKNAVRKSEGVKVKDDIELVKKSLKKQKDQKKKSSEKWKSREARVKQEKEDKQRKRLENIQARAKQKKLNKLKKATKKGRIIAGF